MQRTLAAFALLALGSAGALTVGGSVAGEAPAKARVGAWLVDSAGRPLGELVSAAVNGGQFSLNVPDAAPSGRALWPLSADNIAWPGVTGGVNVPSGVQSGEVRLFVYGDANGNGRRDEGEELLEGTPRLGRANVVLVYADKAASVSAPRGFEAKLNAGWNVLAVELGKTLKTSVQGSANGLQLSVSR